MIFVTVGRDEDNGLEAELSARTGDTYKQTSYNTRGGVHYGANGEPDGGTALRGNYAGLGYTYDTTHDVFYAPQPYPSWTISAPNWTWTPPVPYPTDVGTPEAPKRYTWNETTKAWDLTP